MSRAHSGGSSIDAAWGRTATLGPTPRRPGPPLQTLDELDDPTQPQPINVTLEDLEPNSNYEVRLFVRNSTAGVVSDPAQEFPTQQGSPLVETLKATSTSAFRATLVARVDPRNSDAEWWFELTSENGEAIQLPATPQSLDGKAGATLVTTEALNLEPETMYTYRVMARLQTDHETDAEGDSASFETRPAHESTFAKRGIELVSPVLTNAVATIPYMLSPDGNRAFFDTAIPLPDSENLGFDWRVSSRNEDGTWTVLPNKACAPMVSPG